MYHQSILSNVENYAKKTPEKVALIAGKSKLSYQQLFLRAKTFAFLFYEMGLQRERLAVHLPNSIELAVIYLASLMSGAIVVPLSIGLKQPEVMALLSETAPKALIGNSGSYQLFHDFNFKNSSLKQIFSLDQKPPRPFEVLKMKVGTFEHHSHSIPDDPAAIFYTSGSTNKPKGVVHSERSLTAMMDSMVDALDLTSDGRFLMCEAMTNCSGYTQSLLPLFINATTIIMPFFSITELIDATQHHPTRMSLMGKGNFEIVDADKLTKKHFAGMTLNLTGGDRISKELMGAFKEKTGITLRLGYGMSECLLLTVNKSTQVEKIGSIGQVAKNATIQLLDPKQNPVTARKEGEIWVKGPNCMLGYWGEPTLTNQTIIDGWLRTGDLAHCDVEGFYWFSGRVKQIIIREGENISPFEIEEVLGRHSAVHAVGVIGVPDPTEGAVPHAFVELKQGQEATEQELLAFTKKHLEAYKVPTAIFVVDKLPRTLSGKIDREKLKTYRH